MLKSLQLKAVGITVMYVLASRTDQLQTMDKSSAECLRKHQK